MISQYDKIDGFAFFLPINAFLGNNSVTRCCVYLLSHIFLKIATFQELTDF